MQKKSPVLIHIAGWLFFLILVFAFLETSPAHEGFFDRITSFPVLSFFLIYLLIFYGNIFLLKNFYRPKTLWTYILIIAVLFVAVFFLRPFEHLIRSAMGAHPPPGPPPEGEIHGKPGGPPVDITSIVLFVMTWALSTVSSMLKHYRLTREKAGRAAAEKTKAELSFLKAQINPHFLFNTLNNIYTLTLSRDDKAPEAVMKLSQIMRYVTEEAKSDFVPLQSEISCADDYIELQKLRLNEKTKVLFEADGKTNNKTIAPLIFMPFIENAFNYGISAHEGSQISIRMHANDSKVEFTCSNKVFRKRPDKAGSGIENVKKRLNYLYKNKYQLTVEENNDMFVVNLLIYTE